MLECLSACINECSESEGTKSLVRWGQGLLPRYATTHPGLSLSFQWQKRISNRVGLDSVGLYSTGRPFLSLLNSPSGNPYPTLCSLCVQKGICCLPSRTTHQSNLLALECSVSSNLQELWVVSYNPNLYAPLQPSISLLRFTIDLSLTLLGYSQIRMRMVHTNGRA